MNTLYGFGAGVLAALVGNYVSGWSPFVEHRIPQVEQVQEGFIAPSKLEVKCRDLDKNGESETYVQIGEIPYALRMVDGKPVLSKYEVRPAEIEYRE